MGKAIMVLISQKRLWQEIIKSAAGYLRLHSSAGGPGIMLPSPSPFLAQLNLLQFILQYSGLKEEQYLDIAQYLEQYLVAQLHNTALVYDHEVAGTWFWMLNLIWYFLVDPPTPSHPLPF